MASSCNYSFRLPSDVADKEPKAELENGVLHLTFQKIKKAPPKKIKIAGKSTGKKEIKNAPNYLLIPELSPF